jgi:hypothetical protein
MNHTASRSTSGKHHLIYTILTLKCQSEAKIMAWLLKRFCVILLCSVSFTVFAETRISILDFELNDLTLAPRIPAEIERTASIKPLLEAELKKAGYVIVPIDPQTQQRAENGVGYLFEHHDAAAGLAKQSGADYVLVGRLHKPSFLFVYLMGHLIRVRDARLIGDFISEIKGSDAKLTLKGVENLTVKIDSVLENRYTPPPPAKALSK